MPFRHDGMTYLKRYWPGQHNVLPVKIVSFETVLKTDGAGIPLNGPLPFVSDIVETETVVGRIVRPHEKAHARLEENAARSG